MYNRLNLLVVEIDLLNRIEKYHINSLICLKFENIDCIKKSLEKLQKLGVVMPIKESIGEELYIKYFDNYDEKGNIYNIDSTNKVLFLDSYLNKDIKLNIGYNIKSLLDEKHITYIKKIGRMEYKISSY